MPKQAKCQRCNHEWETKSEYYFVSCPKCGAKVKIASLPLKATGDSNGNAGPQE